MAEQTRSLATTVIRGALWTVGMRWLSRLLGLGSMVVIARLLTPEDFGIVAVATAIIGLIDAFSDMGAHLALIRHPQPLRQHYDTVWTLTVLVHTLSALLIAALGYWAPQLYQDMRYEPVLYALAASMFLGGLTNIGIADFCKHFHYHKDFQLNALTQLAGVIATIALAFWLRSYWALVLGGLARTVVKLALSFIMHRYRPRLSLAAFAEMFGFSFWIMLRSVAMFLSNRADRIILAGYFPVATVGHYAIAGELATMAVFELLLPIGRAVLPALASKQHDPAWLRQNTLKLLSVAATLAAAAGVGLAAVATPALAVIYGSQYLDAAPMLMVLAVAACIEGFMQPVGQLLLVADRARDFAVAFMIEGGARLALTAYLAFTGHDFMTILYAGLAAKLLAVLRLFYLLKVYNSVRWHQVLVAWTRPAIAAAVMFVGLSHYQTYYVLLEPPVLALSTLVAGGGLVFAAVLFGVWVLMLRPAGIEAEVVSRLLKRGG